MQFHLVRRRWPALTVAVLALTLQPTGSAQMGDQRDNQVQKAPPPEWSLPAPVLTPDGALKSFRLPPGFRIELVASEPLVEEPVALDFDPDGRIWVVEMRSYMPDVDGKGEIEPINRIVTLEDTNNDGRMDKRTVYMDGLHLPRLVKVLRDGVLVAEPPYLWWTRDTNGDGVADEKTEIASDYSVRETNPEGGGNAIIWTMDNWLTSSSYGRRFRRQNGQWVSAPVVLRGQWGQSMDDYGRLFTNTNSDYMRADLISNHYPARNPNLASITRMPTGVNHRVDARQELWPIRVTPGVNRGYLDGELRSTGTLWNFTAVCGPLVYRGDNFPAEFYGNYFASEPAAHVIRRSIITEEDGVLSGRNAYDKGEFLGSTDERFRPVNLYTAPDGSMYVVDLYRGILQHRQFMTTYLRKQIVERGLEKGLHYGRIYRIVHESKPLGPKPNLAQQSPAQLVAHLSHPNAWWRDTARRLLIERGDTAAVAALRQLALSSTTAAPVRLQALSVLEGLGVADEPTLSLLMADAAPKIRAAAIRAGETLIKAGNGRLLARMATAVTDPSSEVRLQAALSLGEAPASTRETAQAALAILAKNDAATPFMIPAIVSSLAGGELAFLEGLRSSPEWTEARPGYADLVEMLAATILNEGDATKIDRLFVLVRTGTEPVWRRVAMLSGMQAAPARRLAAFPATLDAIAKDTADPDIARRAAALMTRLDWPGKNPEGPRPLTAAERTAFERGRTVYTTTCAACHQPDGRGADGLAPPLVSSKWVLGHERVLARILLKGKAGRFAAPMPPLEMMTDADLAAVLTYIRRSWGHEAPPVTSAMMGVMRRLVIIRGKPYTEQELETIAVEERATGQ
jgi:mono/diheme cytochrome c family protein/glucose/arabinose dehydrogenase